MATDQVLPSATPRKQVITNPTRQKIDVAKALKLRLQGNTFDEIGTIFSCTGSAVHQALSRFEPFLQGVEQGGITAYSENRSELFNVVEGHLTASLLDPQALEKASLNNRAYALKVIHEARRLETGQSTNNTSILAQIITRAEDGLCKPVGKTPQQVVVQEESAVELTDNTVSDVNHQ